jgi:hypothetical protein
LKVVSSSLSETKKLATDSKIRAATGMSMSKQIAAVLVDIRKPANGGLGGYFTFI